MPKHNKLFCFALALILLACCASCKPPEKEESCLITGNHNVKLTDLRPFESEIEMCGVFTCSDCNGRQERTVTSSDLGLPIVQFNGSLEGISKDDKVEIGVTYTSEDKSFQCDATLKVQGASSAFYPKKNFTIQLYEKGSDFESKYKVEMADGWGRQSKYCLKANWIDFSHARNVVSAKLYGQTSETRDLQDQFSKLVNGGAVDGFPVVIYLNGQFHGLYTWNIPKDEWLFNMKDDDLYEALVMADNWHESTALNQPVSDDFVSTCWELEYCANEDTDGTQWVVDSMNEMIAFLNGYTGNDFAQKLRKYVNVERAIDCMIHTAVISGLDNTCKNIIWVTYDGIQWMPCVYDMDSTWGLNWHGESYCSHTDFSLNLMKNGNMLWRRLWQFYKDDIIDRYFELRQTVYSLNNIKQQFGDFIGSIPSFVYKCESRKWFEIPSLSTSNYDQIIEFANAHLTYLDSEIEKA